jgi:cell pole-organizing protein PopZ
MEEIIAAISRIIAEDNRSVDPVRPAPAHKAAILELTEAIEADGSVRRLTPAAMSSADAEAGKEPSPPSGAARIEPEPPRGDAVAADAKPGRTRERILSSATSGAAATAFAQLGAMPRQRRPEADLLIGAGQRTLEEIVREALRPLLQAWLEEHLPAIVERLVREEIARVVNEAGLR